MSSQWSRVAVGLQMVLKAHAKIVREDAGTVLSRTAYHGTDILKRSSAAGQAAGSQFLTGETLDTFQKGFAQVIQKGQSLSSLQDRATQEAFDNFENNADAGEKKKSFDERLTREADSCQMVLDENQPSELDSDPLAAENTIRSPSSAEDVPEEDMPRLKEGQAVPSTRIGRAFGFARLGIGLVVGSATNAFNGKKQDGDTAVMNDGNATLLTSTLCRMRGAALKLGQMLSIQDETLLPPALSRALAQVRQGADAMPNHQLVKQMTSQLGTEWREMFESFNESPFAAASIGQVHRAKINVDGQLTDVVVKVQYPGVARSIDSDLRNLSMIITWTGLSPKGLFIENVIRVGTEELKSECNYKQELKNQERIKQLVEQDPFLVENRFVVPRVFKDFSTSQILTSEYMKGGTIDKAMHLDQEERDRIGTAFMYLTMQELFVWRVLQSDPNWGNFLYDTNTQTTSLIDFGATREYSKAFVDGYLRIVWASSNRDEEALMDQSYRMNFLTGEENDEMIHAHKQSAYTVGEPFQTYEAFDFRASNISSRMSAHTSVFLKHRLTPPPDEVYTLHRKLAGAYMLCIKLGARVNCRELLEDIVRSHRFEDGLNPPSI